MSSTDDFLALMKDMQIKQAYCHPFGVRVRGEHAVLNIGVKLLGTQGVLSDACMAEMRPLRDLYESLLPEVVFSVSLDAARQIVEILRKDKR